MPATRSEFAITTVSVTIANGATLSDAADLSNGASLVGVILPAALTSTAATFTACDTSSGTFVPVYGLDGASAYSITVGTSRYVPIQVDCFSGVRYLKIVGGSTEGGARTIKFVVRNV